MQQTRTVLRNLCSITLIVVAVGFAYLYSNPYSLHHVVTVPYDGFDAAPTPEGSVEFESQQEPVDFKLPYLAFTDATIAEVRLTLGEHDTGDFEFATMMPSQICLQIRWPVEASKR